ncbi:MAG: lysophospholipid acyltransferase family protein [Burkholderiales bacterium]
MTRALRAGWRLLRCVVHGLHGLAIVLVRFSALDAAQRQVRIQWWAAKMLRMMGIALQVEGAPHRGGTLLIANHISWLDIVALHAVCPQARFVSKADVRSWPLLSQLIDAGGTLYLERERKRDALRVVHVMAQALTAGETVAVFPEGTTSDGRALLPFHANLLQAAIVTSTPIQPVALRFSDRHEAISRAVEFVGDTTLAQSLWRVAGGEGVVARIRLLPPLASGGAERRELSERLRAQIAAALD